MSRESVLAILVACRLRLEFWRRQLTVTESERLAGDPQRYIEHYERQIAELRRLIEAMDREG